MPSTLTMPKLSPTMEEGTIAKWHKKEGDQVKAGDLLFEVATDKATVEYNSLDDGYLRQVLVGDGKEAKVGDPIAVLTETANESIAGYKPEGVRREEEKPKAAAEKSAEPKEAAAPKKAAGGSMMQPAHTPEPPLEGYQFPHAAKVGDRLLASPLAKKLAQEKGVDLASVAGTGPRGRVMSRDLGAAAPTSQLSFSNEAVPTEAPGSYEEIPLTPMRKVIGQRLQESKTFIPHFYVSQEVNADALERLRAELKEGGLKVSVNDFIIKASAFALRDHILVNSGFDSVQGAIVRFKTIDIAVAVSIEAGLITPIVRHADYKTLGQISAEVRELAARARAGKLQREEYSGGSFTISNLGMYGVTQFVGVINPPQAAILAVGGIEERPIARDGQIVVGKTMILTLSADHRVIDGADAAQFLKSLRHYLEHPSLLLLHPAS